MENELKPLIIDALETEDITIADIDSHAPLFNKGLDFNIIDAVDMILRLKEMT